jgi:polar amino acid transport system substrate-binding protein
MKPRKFEEIKLAYVNQFPPFAYSRSGKSEGFGIEILDAALKEVGIKAVYVPKGLDVIKRALQSGEADGIAVYAITPERQKIYDYSDPILQTAERGSPHGSD